MKISACVIVRNEEAALGKCLNSLHSCVDEIIVVDTGSTDGSKAIARQFGAEIYDYKWQDDFAAAKNFAKQQASGEWIIFLDADEYFANDKINDIKKLIVSKGKICDAFMFRMINIDEDNNNAYLDEFYTMRAFKNLPELQFKNPIHEELANITGAKVRLLKLDEGILLYHTGYSKNKIAGKCRRNLPLLLQQLTNTENDKYVYRYLADAYMGIDEYDKACKYAKLDIATGKKEIAYSSRSHRILHICLRELNCTMAERKQWYEKSIDEFPELPDFYGQYGYYLYTLEEYTAAAEYLEESFQKNNAYNGLETSTFHSNLIDYYVVLANIYMLQNNYEAAMEYYNKAINIDSFYIPAVFAWLKSLLQIYSHERVISELRQVYTANDNSFAASVIAMLTHGALLDEFSASAAENNSLDNNIMNSFYAAALARYLEEPSRSTFYFTTDMQKFIASYNQKLTLNENDFVWYHRLLDKVLAFPLASPVQKGIKNMDNNFTVEQRELLSRRWRNKK